MNIITVLVSGALIVGALPALLIRRPLPLLGYAAGGSFAMWLATAAYQNSLTEATDGFGSAIMGALLLIVMIGVLAGSAIKALVMVWPILWSRRP